MRSFRNRDFNKLYALLPAHIQELARKNYRLWCQNPWHPSLQFKEVSSGRWSVRVGARHRAVGTRDGDEIVWSWIGTHETYNKF